MALFLLTAAANDSLVGANNVNDVFQLSLAGQLVGTDTIVGGSGIFPDILLVQSAMTLAAADLANVRDLERITITAAAGAFVTLDNAMVLSGDLAIFQALGGIGGDTISGAGVLARPLNLQGGGGNDSLLGGGGADLLLPGTGADTVLAGAGNDTVTATLAELGTGDVLDGGEGTQDLLRLLTAGGALQGAVLTGFERILVNAAVVTGLTYRIAAETAASADATLTVAGAGGADVLVASAALQGVVLLGEGGADRLVGSQAADLLNGGALNDTLSGYFGNDTLDGGEGDDRMMGGIGNDLLLGGAGNDSIAGGLGNDTIEAGTGTDTTDGGFGNDWLRFAADAISAGDRAIDEDGAADVLEVTGATGIVLGTGATLLALGFERMILGGGADVVAVNTAMGDSAGAGVVTIEGGGGADRLDASGYVALGAPLRFLLRGDDGADTLRGAAGADTIEGGAGRVVASGGAGDDVIIVAPDVLAAVNVSFIDGGAGTADVLRLSEGGTVASADLTTVNGIEVIELSDEGNAIALRPALLAAVTGDVTVRGGAGDDLVDNVQAPTGERLHVELGAGDDSFLGGTANEDVVAGSGNDRILLGGGANNVFFDAGELSALDVVIGTTTTTTDRLQVTLEAGRTLGAAAFDGIAGIDRFAFAGAAGASVRLASDLVSQSGQGVVSVQVQGSVGVVVDGRDTGRVAYQGSSGADLILAGIGADTISSSLGGDTIVGGDGGDRIFLDGGGDRSYAVIVSEFDGTADINGVVLTSTADMVFGTQAAGKLIAAEWQALGLANNFTTFLSAGQDIFFFDGANVLETTSEIAGNAFGSLTAVRNAVGARMGSGTIGDRTILVIGGADETQFGVYLFEDGDNNATIDVADTLRLLAIGSGDVPNLFSDGGFRLVDLDLF